MAKRKEYPNSKPSGVEWLGDVPEEWTVKSLKWETPVRRGASPRPIDDPKFFDEDGRFRWVRISDVTTAGTYLESTEEALSDLGASLSVKLKPGSLFLSIAGSVGKACITKIQCCIHDGFVYFPKWKGCAKFLYYVFASGEPYKGLGKLGTQLNLNTDTVGSIALAIPPRVVQTAIVKFLDCETAKIDSLISKKQQLIEKLKERRTALISSTVTKGLPPEEAVKHGLPANPKMKPSGVEWLGDVPEGWDVTRLGFIVNKVGSGKTPRGGADVYQNYGTMLIRSQNVHDNGLRLEDVVYIDATMDEEMAGTRVHPNDVLLNITGASLGRCSIVPSVFEAANVNQHVCILRVQATKCLARFIHRTLCSSMVQSQIFGYENGSSREGLNFKQVRNLTFPLPTDLKEQDLISTYLDRETSKIDALIFKVDQAIITLQDYRSALITDAVTGKIDLRDTNASQSYYSGQLMEASP